MINHLRCLNSKAGYTLIELLVVISIIGMLLSVALPSYDYATTQAAILKLRADLQAIDSAISTYTITTGTFPATLADIGLVTMGYFRSEPHPPPKVSIYSLTAKKYEIDPDLKRSYVQLDDHTRFYSDSAFPAK